MKKQLPDRRCELCVNFVQHYGKATEVSVRYFPVYCGHCVKRSLTKKCLPGTPACDTYTPRLDEEEN